MMSRGDRSRSPRWWACRTPANQKRAFPRVRGNQKGASPACGGIKGGTGVALMVTLGFGRAGVEMLRSAQHDRLVPMNDAYERSRISLNPRFIE